MCQPPTSTSLRKDIRRLMREKPTSTFEEVKTEAQRWMHEDSLDAAATDQLLTTPSNEAITQLEGQIASLTTETASLRQTLHQYDRPRQPFQQPHQERLPRQHQRQWQPPQPTREGRLTQPRRKECLWCGRRGHEELSATLRFGTSSAPGSASNRETSNPRCH